MLAARRLGLKFEFIDDEGYLFAVHKEDREVTFGSGACSPFVVNSAKAYTLCRDKAYTYLLLARAGLPTIPYQLYFLDERRAAWRKGGRERGDLEAWAAKADFPLFAKPNLGSRGEFAEQINSRAELTDWIERVSQAHESVLVQPLVRGREYRVFVLDGEALFSYRREAAAPGPANLAQGGQVREFTDRPPQALADFAIRAAEIMNLRLAGVDVFDRAGPGEAPDLVAIEVNANPNFESLEIVGREDLILRIWETVFETAFSQAGPLT